MTKAKTTALALLLTCAVAAGIAGATALSGKPETANALDASSTVAYPFTKGETAFVYGPTYDVAEQPSEWPFVRNYFTTGTTDFTQYDYLGVQLRMDRGNVGFTIGVMGVNEGGVDAFQSRLMTKGTNADADNWFVSENGSVKQIPVTGDAVTIGEGAKGMLMLSIDELQDWDYNPAGVAVQKNKVGSLFITFNPTLSNYAFTMGEIVLIKGDLAAETLDTQKIFAFNGKEDRSNYFNNSYLTYSYVSDNSYPKINWNTTFRIPSEENKNGFLNTMQWKGQASPAADETLKISFDAAKDLSAKTHILVQYYNPGWGNPPRLQFSLASGSTLYPLKADQRVFFLGQTATWAYNAFTTNADGVVLNGNGGNISRNAACRMMGAVVLPIAAFNATAENLANIDAIVINGARATNIDFVFGEVASYVGEYGDGTYKGGTSEKLLDLATAKENKYTATTSTVTKLTERPAVTSSKVYGDARLDSFFTENDAKEENINAGGAEGTVEMTTDSYGQDALKFTATAHAGDGYFAYDELGTGLLWSGMKGVTFWARNDGDKEVDFNFELDCQSIATSGGEKYVAFDRFNLQQGSRFWLYDLRTGRTSVYMTRDTVTLPAGFEGWVRIPFSAFQKAVWSGKGVSAADFMCENSVVSYLGISMKTPEQVGNSFSINMLGSYATTPEYGSFLVDNTGKSIAELMELEESDLELQPKAEVTAIALDGIDLIPASKEEN